MVSDRWLIVAGGTRARRYALAARVAADLPRLAPSRRTSRRRRHEEWLRIGAVVEALLQQ